MDELVVSALTELGKSVIILGVSALVLLLAWGIKQSFRTKE